ncbi:MAG: GEVED domain-containing protein [Bacteroidia bacterium]
MKNLYTTHVPIERLKAFSAILMLIIVLSGAKVMAQPAVYTTQQAFAANIPYNIVNPNLRVDTADWTQGKILGTSTAPNDFEWVNAVANPAAGNVNIAGFPAGAGFVRYINRTVAYGGGVAGVNYAAPGDQAFLATRSLDFSGHTLYNAAADTFGFAMWRDNSGGALLGVLDYIEVYINTSPSTTGATLLSERISASNRVHRSTTQAPVTGTPGWNWYSYTVPNLASYVSPTGGSSNVYIIIVGTSAGGNNIYLDNFNLSRWPTNMQVVNSTLFYQENADVGKGSLSNLLLGVSVTTKGSVNPLRLDGATFSSNGSTNWLGDVTASYAYFTGGSSNFATAGGAVSMPSLGVAGPGVGTFNYGWWSAGCPAPLTPASMNLNPGSENYVWYAVDVNVAATAGNYIGADFQFATVRPGGTCTYYGNVGSSTNLIANPILPQTLGQARQIDQSYTIPTYTVGTSFLGYNQNDYVSAVNLIGDNGTQLNNYDHDAICGVCVPSALSPAHCIRLACHPPDYTQFKPLNLATYRNRIVQLTVGFGKRGLGPAYTLKSQPGEWPFNSNNIAVFIDWNKDGDFTDSYNGLGGPISENYGTKTMLNGDLNNYPILAWPANTTWTIDVPDKADVVTNVGGAGGPIFLGNVRMRVREVFAATNIDPVASIYTFGEVEDYTIQVLDACPAPATNVCKWIGNTNDWNAATNWCPAKPTINDMAYIPLVSAPFVYPTIKENTTATCRILKLMDNGAGAGAQLNIDATKNGLLLVSDDVIIGQSAPVAGSNANINVISNFQNTLTIPGKSSVPPLGLALLNQTPFRANAQAKTQIAYTPAELAGTFGWKQGDVIDQISIEVNNISGGAGPSTFQNFRIQAYLVSGAAITFPFPAPANTSISVSTVTGPYMGNIVLGWPKTIYTGAPLTLNMPQGVNGTQAGGNYFTFVLPNTLPSNTLIWDGASNLVLSFENWTSVGIAPVKSYVLYDEPNGAFNVLSVNYNTVPGAITGYNIDGAGHWTGGSNPFITATVSNNRPRLDFKWHRPYDKAVLVIGGDWINNNKGVKAPSVVPGSDGFRAGYSLVSFDPVTATRSTVNSPGLTGINFWNTAVQPASLGGALADIDQDITSLNDARTVFNQLEIKKATATAKAVRLNSNILSVFGANADSLALTTGELYLNRREFTLQNSNASYLARLAGGGWIRSEDNSGGAGVAGNVQSKFTWKISTGTTGNYVIPFKGAPANVFNFSYNKAIAGEDVGDLTVATYGTPIWNNTPYPVAPQPVMSMTTNPTPIIVDATPWTVDRFWYIKRTTATPLTGTINFEYDNAEGTVTANYVATEMKAQRYEVTGVTPGWHVPYPGQSDASVAGKSSVTHSAAYIDNTYNIWTVVHINGIQSPLPLSITNFSAKQIDKRVKLWWNVQSETNVTNYSIERTVDQSFYELITSKLPTGPSNSILNYEAWDNKPLRGTQFYRLASSNTDGSVKYYGPVSVNFGTAGLFEITNVVASDNASIKVDFNYDSSLPFTYMVTDMLGNVVAKGDSHNAASGENSIVIPINLAHGIYAISLINDEKTVSQKLVY